MKPAEDESADLADARAFGQLLEVLAGRLRLPLDGRSSKMFRILFGGSNDGVVTSEGFAIHFGPQKQRRPNTYFLQTVPPIASELLDRASIASVREPLVIGLPPGKVAKTDGFPAWPYEAKVVWVVPGDGAVKLAVRPSPERWHAPFVHTIPPSGPLALHELPEWAPQVEYKQLGEPLVCPTCAVASSRYRQIRGALVCGSCGRSFEHAG